MRVEIWCAPGGRRCVGGGLVCHRDIDITRHRDECECRERRVDGREGPDILSIIPSTVIEPEPTTQVIASR
ncbi:MAG: hypothetical protein LZF60_380124 [Nitrospira sp.]|nr:MAG: hypothetical protein LZF60_380124 [Nitrospira sp.]